MSHIKKWIALFALVFATGALAAADERKCNSEIYAAIERDLRLADFAEQAQRESGRFIVSEACKTWPYKPELTLVAVAYDAGVEDEKELVVAVFDKKRKRVVHSYQRRIVEDSSIAVGERSLEFDTARYQLADNVRAFGLRFNNSARGVSGAEFYWNDQLILLVPEGKSLRQALSLYRSQSRVNGGRWPDFDWESASISIGVEKTPTSGFYDLRVTATIEEGGDRVKREHVIFRYNGKHYAPVGKVPWWLAFDPSPK